MTNIDLTKPAFIRAQRTITFAEFSRDIAGALTVLGTQLSPNVRLVGLSAHYGYYLHWVLHFACMVRGIATLSVRSDGQMPDGCKLLIPRPSTDVTDAVVIDGTLLGSAQETEPGNALRQVFAQHNSAPEIGNRVVMTSGTTGKPKTVALTNGILAARLAAIALRDPFRDDDCIVCTVGLDTVGGFSIPFDALLLGLSVIVPPRGGDIADYRVAIELATRVAVVPAVLQRLLQVMDGGILHGNQQRQVTTVGARAEPALIAEALDRICSAVRVIYGSTEAGSVASYAITKENLHETHSFGYAGQLYEDVELRTEAEDGTQLGVGERGIVAVRSPRTVTEYMGGDAQHIFKDGWFYPGDMGYVTTERELYIDGRVDDRLTIFGDKLLAPQLESQLCADSSIREAFVAVVKRDNSERFVVLAVSDSEKSALRAQVSVVLGGRPFDLIKVPRVPRNHMGKYDRNALTAYCQDLLAAHN